MKAFTASWVFAAIVAALTFPALAHADSYKVYDLGGANHFGIYGIDSSGAVVISNSECGLPGQSCYRTMVDGLTMSDSPIPPTLNYEDGDHCSLPSGFDEGTAVCNGAWIGFGSRDNPNGNPSGVYTGSLSDLTWVGNGTADQLFLNASGDFAWTDGRDEEIFEAVDTSSTPEPSSIVLVGSGILFLLETKRRCRLVTRDKDEAMS